jgi:hypothetical protein
MAVWTNAGSRIAKSFPRPFLGCQDFEPWLMVTRLSALNGR